MRWLWASSETNDDSSAKKKEDGEKDSNGTTAGHTASTQPTATRLAQSLGAATTATTTTTPPASPPSATAITASKSPQSSWSSPRLPSDWRHYTQPDVVLPATLLAGLLWAGRRVYTRYLRRIRATAGIGESVWRRRSLLGRVTSVGDGDGFRMFHTPGGRLAGWGWLPGRAIPTGRAALRGNTISVRLAGVDAPEAAHFGRPAQPGGQEALDWLTGYLGGRTVRARVWRRDQYDRAVATVHVRRWGGLVRRDVGLEMLRRGLATVYEAKSGAEFGDLEERYRSAERTARRWRRGIWKAAGAETPRQYKDRMKQLDNGDGTKEEREVKA